MTVMTRPKSPTVKRRRLAITLRGLRETKKLTVTDAARRVERDPTWLSRIENVESGIHTNDLRALLELYGVKEPELSAILDVGRHAKQRGWWQPYNSVLPDWFTNYVGLEAEASVVRTYECQVVPGLLQTEDYARATVRMAPTSATSAEIDKQVALRVSRQAILTGDDPPQYRAILDQAVLHREVGGRRVLREQLEHLVELAEQPHIQILVLPYEAGMGFDGSFIILDFPPIPEPYPQDTADDRMVYVDILTGAHYLEKPHEIAAYTQAYEQLCTHALRPEQSIDLVRTIAKHLTA